MKTTIAMAATLFLVAACSTAPRPLAPDTIAGPTSYVCYSSLTSTPEQVRTVADAQCSRWGQGVTGLVDQGFSPFRCGILTPTVAVFQCGTGPMTAP